MIQAAAMTKRILRYNAWRFGHSGQENAIKTVCIIGKPWYNVFKGKLGWVMNGRTRSF